MTVIAAALLAKQLAAIQRDIQKTIADPTPKCVVVQHKPDADTFVCVAFDEADDNYRSEVRLYRVSKTAAAQLVSTAEARGWHAEEISLQNVLHSRTPQVLVRWCCARSEPGSLYRVKGREIEEIFHDGLYWGFITFDEDWDGIDEILSTGCCEIRECATGISMDIMKSHGDRYAREHLKIVDAHVLVAGGEGQDWSLALPSGDHEFALHIVNGGRPGDRIRKATIRIDGKVLPGVNVTEKTRTLDRKIRLDSTCHTINGHVEGPDGAKLLVFVTKP